LRFYREREKAGEDLERKVEVSRDSKGERERERERERMKKKIIIIIGM